MPRTPQKDEGEQTEYSYMHHSTQRRKTVATTRRSSFDYRTDERPEVPKIRRASLRPGEANVSPTTTKHRVPKVEGTQRSQSAQRSSYAPHAPRESTMPNLPMAKRATRHEDDYADYSEHDEGPVRDTTGRIIATRPPRSSSYQSPRQQPPYRPRDSYTRRRRPAKRSLQELSYNQHAILVGTLVLVALIVFPIIINAVINNARHPVKALSLVTTQGAVLSTLPPVIKAPQADPHGLVITPQDTDHPAPPVFAQAAYLLDADTGATLYAYNPFTHLPVLSTTKLMTATLAVELGHLDQHITITSQMQDDINQLSADSALFGVKQGEIYTLRDLLYGLLYVSGNDAAIVIADAIGGNLPHFVAMMNQRAAQMGLHDTHFMNPHGLLMPGHYSSAHDLAILGRYALSLPAVHEISSQEQYHITQTSYHQEHWVVNGNQFLWWYPGVDGGKTGYDGDTDFVQVVSCTRNNHHLIGVVIHTIDWWTDMRNLMNWGFDSFSWISPYDVDFQHPIPYDNEWNYFSKDKKDLTIPTANGGRYYIYTGYSISGPILGYFDKGHGLQSFGYPTGMPTATSNTVISQRFEHGTIQCTTTNRQCKTIK